MDLTRPPPSMLMDRFHRLHDYLRISLIEKCNLRCTYCMPEEGVELSPDGNLLTREEILRIATLFVKNGVTKIRLTGGEPTIRKDLLDIVTALNALRPDGLRTIAMTTNGIVLKRMLPALSDAGLDLVNISLDTLDPHKYVLMTRRKGMERVLEAVDASLNIGIKTKVNCVIMKGVNDDEVGDFVEITRDKPIEVRFIEYMPFGGNKWNHDKLVPYTDLLNRLKTRFGPLQRLEDHPNDTSKTYHVPSFLGRVGFITSMTEHFCHSCNRLRITADGNLKVCLFGDAEVSLRDKIRQGASDQELEEMVHIAVGKKKRQHAGMSQLATNKNRPMILIGG